MSAAASFDFIAVSVPTSDADTLASQLTERSAAGWEVVSIVASGSGLTAFCRRASDMAERDDGDDTATGVSAAAQVSAPEPADSPPPTDLSPGWGATGTPHEAAPAPAPAPTASPEAPLAATPATADSGAHAATHFGAQGHPHTESAVGAPTPAVSPGAPAQAPVSQPSTSQVPAGWYSDPSGRYELRYWDGNEWTEHVARNGQQYTDPPVA